MEICFSKMQLPLPLPMQLPLLLPGPLALAPPAPQEPPSPTHTIHRKPTTPHIIGTHSSDPEGTPRPME
jgi:hypothetical protein